MIALKATITALDVIISLIIAVVGVRSQRMGEMLVYLFMIVLFVGNGWLIWM